MVYKGIEKEKIDTYVITLGLLDGIPIDCLIEDLMIVQRKGQKENIDDIIINFDKKYHNVEMKIVRYKDKEKNKSEKKCKTKSNKTFN